MQGPDRVHVYLRSSEIGDLDLVKRMLIAAKLIEVSEIYNISTKDIESTPEKVENAIVFGKITARLLLDRANRIFELPGVELLRPLEKNLKVRQKAWEQIQEIKKILENAPRAENTDSNWRYSIIDLPGQKKICVFETEKPSHIKADIFISKADSNLLLKMKEAFKAESVIIQGEE